MPRGGVQTSLVGMISALTAPFRRQTGAGSAPSRPGQRRADPLLSWGQKTRDITQFAPVFQPSGGLFAPGYPLVPGRPRADGPVQFSSRHQLHLHAAFLRGDQLCPTEGAVLTSMTVLLSPTILKGAAASSSLHFTQPSTKPPRSSRRLPLGSRPGPPLTSTRLSRGSSKGRSWRLLTARRQRSGLRSSPK
jgi:hypothetical protein